jgi:hypothetical protein
VLLRVTVEDAEFLIGPDGPQEGRGAEILALGPSPTDIVE